jgi:DegV family protein with EDD domain
MNFLISTENTCDLNDDYLNENGVQAIKMFYTVGNQEYGGDSDKNLDLAEFYNQMRRGARTTTSMINQTRATDFFENLLKQGKDILHISFASACSGTFESMLSATQSLAKKSKNKIYVVDSLCESAGQGLLVKLVVEYAKTHDIEATYDYANDVKNRINLIFTVDDLSYLARNGRVSKFSATVGNVLKIKPLLSVDEKGKLTPRTKVMTRRLAIKRLIEKTKEKFSGESQKIIIGHGDCLDTAQYVKEQLSCLSNDIEIENIGPVIGAHSGPGTLAIFFLGNDRKF